MNDERERLLQAKELVGEKRFDEARAILRTMPHNPTAQKWLDQLDRSGGATPPPPATPQRAPNPPASAFEPRPDTDAALRNEIGGQPSPRKRPQISDEQMEQARAQMQATLSKAGISLNLAVMVLLLAVVSGVVAALLDTILGLPAGLMSFTFGGFAAALVGMSYPLLRGKVDLGGLAVAAVGGLVTMVIWFILSEILIGEPDPKTIDDINSRLIYKSWFNEYLNILKALLAGIWLGLAGFGWYALIPFLREKVQPLLPNLEK